MNLATKRGCVPALVMAALAIAAYALPAYAADPVAVDGLIPVQSRNLDLFLVRPNTDLAGYRKIMIDPVIVAFAKNWLKSMNFGRDVTRWIYQDQVDGIANEATSTMGSVVALAFGDQGYEVVSAPGPGVLRLSPAVADLFINAADVQGAGPSRSYTKDAGTATLVLEARDAVNGTLLFRVIDRNIAIQIGRINRTTGVSNRVWFENMFRLWAGACVNAFEGVQHPPATTTVSLATQQR